MIFEFKNGTELVEKYSDYLDTNKYLSAFFRIDAPLVTEITDKNFVYSAENGAKRLLAMRFDPFAVLLFGDAELTGEMLDFLFLRGCLVDHFMCDDVIGSAVTDYMRDRRGIELIKALGMDFMECREKGEPTDPSVETPTEADTDELAECMARFVADCGLIDVVNKEHIKASVGRYRVVRANGKIVSCAAMTRDTDESMKLVSVYTRDEYRGKGYARKAVNAVRNEIIDMGYIATLNVDQKNQISYHLYSSLGFKKLFSHGEYRVVSLS